MMAFLITPNSPLADWLVFIGTLLVIGICITCFIVWMKLLRRPKRKRKRRSSRHQNRSNPTRAEAGGLPPPRNPGEPPKGA